MYLNTSTTENYWLQSLRGYKINTTTTTRGQHTRHTHKTVRSNGGINTNKRLLSVTSVVRSTALKDSIVTSTPMTIRELNIITAQFVGRPNRLLINRPTQNRVQR